MDESQESAVPRAKAGEDEFVEFFRAGDPAVGAFECVACGQMALHRGVLPRCPACGSALWERGTWSPFAGELSALGRKMALLSGGEPPRFETPRTPALATSRGGRARSSARDR
jgi:hypothetical protein